MALTINHQTNDISATSGSVTLDGAAAGGGSYSLLSTTNVTSGVASIDLSLSGSYKKYVIDYFGLETSSDADAYLQMRVSTDAGSTFITSSNYMYRGEAWGRNSVDGTTGGSIQSNSGGNDRINIYDPQSASNDAKSGQITIFDPTNANLHFQAIVNYNHINSNAGLVFGAMAASYTVDADYDAVRLFASNGAFGTTIANFTSGTVKLYGVS